MLSNWSENDQCSYKQTKCFNKNIVEMLESPKNPSKKGCINAALL